MEKCINIICSACVKKEDKILMVQENKKEVKNLWDLPGGKLKTDEDIKEAVIREIMEETGFKINVNSILLIQNYVTNKGVLLIIYFNGVLEDKKQLDYRKNEIKNVKWFTIEEMENLPKESIRGGDGFENIIYNIKNNISYPLEILDIHNYIKKL